MVLTKCILFGFLNFGLLNFQYANGSVAMHVDKSCVPRNCSQPPFKPGLQSFPCKIGHRTECDAAASWYNEHSTEKGYHSFAYLANIGTYMYIDRTSVKVLPNPSLNFTITTPYGGGESLATRAVRVDFDSPSGYGEDSFYSKNPRCRLFDFRNATRQTFDIQHPRELSYACLVGLSIRNEVTYNYRLRLTSLPSFAFTEYFLVVHSEPRTEKYKIVLATAVIPMHRSVHVVWEQPPLYFNIVSYDVSLSSREGQFKTEAIKFGEESFEFENLKPDVFVVKVEPKTKNGSSPCFFTESKPIRLVYTLEGDGPKFSMLNTVLAVVGGTVMGAILLIVLILCWKKQHHRTPRQRERILIGANADRNVVEEVATLIRHKMNIHVKIANTSNIPFEKMIKSNLQKHEILVICSNNATELISKSHRPNYSNDYFCRAFKFLKENKSPCKTYIACVHENTSCPHNHLNLNPQGSFWKPSNLLRKKESVYKLLDDFVKLGRNFGNGHVDKSYSSSREWKKLKETINGRQSENGQEGTELGPLDHNQSNSSMNEHIAIKRSQRGLESSELSLKDTFRSNSSMDKHILMRRSQNSLGTSREYVGGDSMNGYMEMQHETLEENSEEGSNVHLEPQQSQHNINKYASCKTLLSTDIEVNQQMLYDKTQEIPPLSPPHLWTSKIPQSVQSHISELPEHVHFDSGFNSSPALESEMSHCLQRYVRTPAYQQGANYHGNRFHEHPETHFCHPEKFERAQCHQQWDEGREDRCPHHDPNYQQYPQHYPPLLQHSPRMDSCIDSGHFDSSLNTGNMSFHYRPEDANYRPRCEHFHRQNSSYSRQDSNYSNYSRQDSNHSRYDSSHSSTSPRSPQLPYMQGDERFPVGDLEMSQSLLSSENESGFFKTNYQCLPGDGKTQRNPPLDVIVTPESLPKHMNPILLNKKNDNSSIVNLDTMFLPPDSPENLSLNGEFFLESDDSGEAHIALKSFDKDYLPIVVDSPHVSCHGQTFERSNSDPETCNIKTSEMGRNEASSECSHPNKKHLAQIQDTNYQEEPLLSKITMQDKFDSGISSMN